ncbi:MAG: tetratricopeptide repeat protein [Candidatus Aminicenantes bacterium]|nr:tetratricopeptide repeat protein [Candidatus Aminicenantes bacterium]
MKKNIFCLLILVAFLACGGGKPRTAPGQIQPGSAEYLTSAGIGYLNNGRLDLAKKSLLEALQKKPRLEPALNALGLVYAYQRDFIKATTTLNRLIQISPKFYDAYNLLGTVYTELGNYQQAKEKLLVAANADEYLTPENAFANLAVLEIKFEKYDSALRYIEKGMLLNRRFAPLYNLNGLALENLGKLADASENYEKAIALITSPDPGYLINSARVLSKLGDKKKALDNLELALGKARDAAQKAEIIKMIKILEGG